MALIDADQVEKGQALLILRADGCAVRTTAFAPTSWDVTRREASEACSAARRSPGWDSTLHSQCPLRILRAAGTCGRAHRGSGVAHGIASVRGRGRRRSGRFPTQARDEPVSVCPAHANLAWCRPDSFQMESRFATRHGQIALAGSLLHEWLSTDSVKLGASACANQSPAHMQSRFAECIDPP
jgi:hypothetical protein